MRMALAALLDGTGPLYNHSLTFIIILTYFRTLKNSACHIVNSGKAKISNSTDVFLVGTAAYHGQVGQAEFAGI